MTKKSIALLGAALSLLEPIIVGVLFFAAVWIIRTAWNA